MKLKNIGYAALVTLATAAFVLGSVGSSEAAKKKGGAKASMSTSGKVCAAKGKEGLKFTSANASFAKNDGAKVVSAGPCKDKKAKKGGKKKEKKGKKGKKVKKK